MKLKLMSYGQILAFFLALAFSVERYSGEEGKNILSLWQAER